MITGKLRSSDAAKRKIMAKASLKQIELSISANHWLDFASPSLEFHFAPQLELPPATEPATDITPAASFRAPCPAPPITVPAASTAI